MLTNCEYYRTKFDELLTTTHQRHDILRAQIEVEGLAGQSGSMGWDPNSERSVLQENDPTEFQDLREQTQLLDRATSDLVVKPDPNLDDFPEFQARGDGLWLGIVQLAKPESTGLVAG